MAAEEIFHAGTILDVGPEITRVSIIAEEACGSCHASLLCSMSSAQRKIIDVPTDPQGRFNVGDSVCVMARRSMGTKAVWISYAFPLAVLLILILSLQYAGAGELASGLISILGVAVYYFVIWLLRGKLTKDYVFYLKPNN